jgi:hypothetical protein
MDPKVLCSVSDWRIALWIDTISSSRSADPAAKKNTILQILRWAAIGGGRLNKIGSAQQLIRPLGCGHCTHVLSRILCRSTSTDSRRPIGHSAAATHIFLAISSTSTARMLIDARLSPPPIVSSCRQNENGPPTTARRSDQRAPIHPGDM